MKPVSFYPLPIKYALVYVVLILLSGVWLFLLSQGLGSSDGVLETVKQFLIAPEAKSVRGLMEVVTPHLFGMGALIFVIAHFMLFSTKVSQKVSLAVAVVLFVFALFDIFAYFAISFGWLVSGWIKAFALVLYLTSFLLLLGLLAFSL